MFFRNLKRVTLSAVVLFRGLSAYSLVAEEPALPVLPIRPALAAPVPVDLPIAVPVAAEAVVSEQGTVVPEGTRVARAELPAEKSLTAIPQKILDLAGSEESFKPLVKDTQLTGWSTLDGKREAWISNGNIVSCISPGGGWLCTSELYSDFICKFEYRLTAGANTGIGFRCLNVGNPSSTGLEVQLLDDTSEKYSNLRPEQKTGSLYYKQGPIRAAALLKPGAWNQAEIICFGNLIRIKINDEIVNEVDLSRVRPSVQQVAAVDQTIKVERPVLGPIAFQSSATRVDFRALQICDLTEQAGDGVKVVNLQEGDGAQATSASVVQIHYRGQLLDGAVFANSLTAPEPVTVSLEDVIPGWQTGISGMKVGGRRRIIVPPDQAYGAEGVEKRIPPNSLLIFDVELLGISDSSSD